VVLRDLGDEGLDGGEGEVGAVAEDGVTRPGKSHQAGGAARELAGQFLGHGQRADRVVLAGEDQDGAPDSAGQARGPKLLPGIPGLRSPSASHSRRRSSAQVRMFQDPALPRSLRPWPRKSTGQKHQTTTTHHQG
jgi:hypothetical protein